MFVRDDGVLTISGRRVTLQDTTSRVLTNPLVSFSTDKMELGSCYFVGTFEIELGDPIPTDEYQSGRIFVGGTAAPAAISPTKVENNAAAAGGGSTSTPFVALKRTTMGAGLFTKQAVCNRQQSLEAAEAQKQAMLEDESILLLNRAGIVSRGEKVS